jgi:hypothetical protein
MIFGKEKIVRLIIQLSTNTLVTLFKTIFTVTNPDDWPNGVLEKGHNRMDLLEREAY